MQTKRLSDTAGLPWENTGAAVPNRDTVSFKLFEPTRKRQKKKQAAASSLFKLDSESEGEGSDEERATAYAVSRALVGGSSMAALEDAPTKVKRLKNEGNTLAEAGKFWQAIKQWNAALEIDADHAIIHELKAQAMLTLGESLPAVRSASEAVRLEPAWAEAHLTLVRTACMTGV
jgi:tetratricopeptide (TPR) repeat protein